MDADFIRAQVARELHGLRGLSKEAAADAAQRAAMAAASLADSVAQGLPERIAEDGRAVASCLASLAELYGAAARARVERTLLQIGSTAFKLALAAALA